MIKLATPYFSQMNNGVNYGYQPYQQCNVTALSMCAAFFLDSQAKDDQGWEQRMMAAVVNSGGSPYSPQDLATAFNAEFPTLHDRFSSTAEIPEIIEHLDAGNPAVIHGYFTRSGHIVTVVGYPNSEQLFINDPYGEWYPSGYDINGGTNQTKGKSNVFNRSTIDELCNFGGIWTHFIKRK